MVPAAWTHPFIRDQIRAPSKPGEVAEVSMAPTVGEVIQQCKAALKAHYGARFRGLVVYGSVARNEATSASDIDLLVLLDEPFDHFHELRQIIDLLYPIQLESERLTSARPAPVKEFGRDSIQLYRDAKKDGVFL